MNPSLIIAGIDVSIISWLDFDQNIQPISGASVRRMANGSAFKMSGWRKYRISLSGSGWIPPALNAIDYDSSFEIELPIQVAINVAESLPPGWTSRDSPWGEETITDQAGNSVRLIYPKMTVIAEPPQQNFSVSGTASWELVCEEI